MFVIDDVTGDISAAKEIDFEVTSGSIRLEVQAQDMGRDLAFSSVVEVGSEIKEIEKAMH